MHVAQVCTRIIEWIRVKTEKAGAQGVLFGLSGGIDSAVVAVLCKRALGDTTLGLIMSCHSSSQDEKYAAQIARTFDIRVQTVCVDAIYDGFVRILPAGKQIAYANLKPRIRMSTLYYFASNLNYLVVGTGNKSEIMVGYFTKYGDGGVDIEPIGGLLKTEVMEIARYLKVPEEIINKPPSAGLWAGQTDEEEMGITYKELDQIILFLEGKIRAEIPEAKLEKVKAFIENSQHKRNPPPIFQV